MPRKKTIVEPLPQAWLDAVIPLLEEGDPGKVHWTSRAQRDMPFVGFNFKQEAYELCLRVLRAPGMVGQRIIDMSDDDGRTACETWAFLCPHPLKLPEPLYVKIGLHSNRLQINIFSLHIDTTGTLKRAIQAYLKRKK